MMKVDSYNIEDQISFGTIKGIPYDITYPNGKMRNFSFKIQKCWFTLHSYTLLHLCYIREANKHGIEIEVAFPLSHVAPSAMLNGTCIDVYMNVSKILEIRKAEK